MKWTEVTVKTESAAIDALCGRLEKLGVDGLSIEDGADFNAFLANNHQYWDYVDDDLSKRFEGVSQVKFYLAADQSGDAQLERIRSAITEEISTRLADDSEWENNWRDYYQPIRIGERLLVVPEWEEVAEEGRVLLRLDPGLIFGTGSHATTRMCLEALQEYPVQGTHVLDLGCGSGILGIGAKVLGCTDVVGVDIDPKAPDVALGNAKLNGISEKEFRIYAGDLIGDDYVRRELDGSYEIVLANIVADVVIPLSAFAARYMAPNGLFICSGIIDHRSGETEDALRENGLEIIEHKHQEEWHCYVCRTKH